MFLLMSNLGLIGFDSGVEAFNATRVAQTRKTGHPKKRRLKTDVSENSLIK